MRRPDVQLRTLNGVIHLMNCSKLISPVLNITVARIFHIATFLATLIVISSCTSSNLNDGLRPSAGVSNENTRGKSTPQRNANNKVALAPDNDSLSQNQTPTPGVVFLPVVGPPQFAVSSLSSSVRNSARNNAITIIPNGQAGASYQVKGYFSALDDGSGTILVFIWDILDNSGKTLHRISGEERTASRKTDPWTAISNSMIDQVVKRTMQNLRQWLNART